MKTVKRRRTKWRWLSHRLGVLLAFCLAIIACFVNPMLQYGNNNGEDEFIMTRNRKLFFKSNTGQRVEVLFANFSVGGKQVNWYRYSPSMIQKARRQMQRSKKKGKPSIVFGILSSPENREARQAIRDSWGKEEAIFFVVAGKPSGLEFHRELANSHDMVHLEAREDYRSGLTRKTMLIIHLFHHLFDADCRQSCYDYLFKTDDDSYVNTTQLRLELSDKDPKTLEPIEYYGEPSVKTEPDRDPSSRYYTSLEEFPGNFYPPYAFGMGYALSSNLVGCINHQMAQVRKHLPWEDVATGRLVKKCDAKLTWAHWSLPGYPAKWQVGYFPYDTLKAGGHSVTLVHGVKNPSYMNLLHHQLPLPAPIEIVQIEVSNFSDQKETDAFGEFPHMD